MKLLFLSLIVCMVLVGGRLWSASSSLWPLCECLLCVNVQLGVRVSYTAVTTPMGKVEVSQIARVSDIVTYL